MKQYCFVIVNNAGNSWAVMNATDLNQPREQPTPMLPQLLEEGWVPVRETPMGGGTSPLAHSLVLLERTAPKPARTPRAPKS
jgi:hypothetical protein